MGDQRTEDQKKVDEALKAVFGLGLTQGYHEYKRLENIIKIGLIVNPIAGMGGRVGLKGTDKKVLDKALEMGAKPVAPTRALDFLNALSEMKEAFQLFTCSGEMGEREAIESGFSPEIIESCPAEHSKSTSEDTVNAAKVMERIPVNLIVFVGGDGTARDVYNGLKSASDYDKPTVPVIGIPSGVKMYSGVFSLNPVAGAGVVKKFIRTGLPPSMVEVMDIDEGRFRAGELSAKLYGYLLTPYDPELVQSVKRATHSVDEELTNQMEIARYVSERLDKDTTFILCPGSTVYALGKILGLDKSLLGVDILFNQKIIEKDVNESKILEIIDKEQSSSSNNSETGNTLKNVKIIVTPIGGQGFIFGRGNQQISPEILKRVGRDNIIVISTRNKLKMLKKLRVDTGDPEIDEMLKGPIKVITGYEEEVMLEIA